MKFYLKFIRFILYFRCKINKLILIKYAILSDLATDIRDWVNNGHEDATPEEVAKEWCMAPATFKNFIENFQKVNWKDIFIFI